MSRCFPLFLFLSGCDALFGSAETRVIVPIERAAEAAPSTPREREPAADAHEVGERVWALLQLGQHAAAEQSCADSEAVPPTGTVHARALLLYRCARVAEARGDEEARRRRFDAAFVLFETPRIARALRPLPETSPLPADSIDAVLARLAALGAHDAQRFVLVDGPAPLPIGNNRVATFEACARPSEVCQAALVTLAPDGHALDALLVPYGAAPDTLEVLDIPGANVVAMRADLPAQLRLGLYLAARVDAGRITPVGLVHATPTEPDRPARVRLEGSASRGAWALVIDERPCPWDARLRLFRGAPVAASPP